ELIRVWPVPEQIGIIINGLLNALRRIWRVPSNMLRFLTGSLKPSPAIYRAVHDFHRALAKNEPAPVSPEEGRRVVAWMASASEAADLEKKTRLETEVARPLPPARILV